MSLKTQVLIEVKKPQKSNTTGITLNQGVYNCATEEKKSDKS